MSKRRSADPGRLEVHEGWYSHFLGNHRTLTVYVPPGYDADVKRRCPVLYLHDGQNLFDPARATFSVSWGADATAERLILARRIPPLLLVGIDNTPDRMDEYSCHRDAEEQTGGRGSLYARFVLEEVKPFIDGRYRTRPGRQDTAVAGSSMGGLVSLSMAREHSDRFGLCGVVSPSLWWADGAALQEIEDGDKAWMRRMRFWLDMGTREDGVRVRGHVTPSIRSTRRLVACFDEAGLIPGRDYLYWEIAGGEHNEAAWAARFDKMLLYFFGR
jgi:predicted alpha/beta superfamily hydrolase